MFELKISTLKIALQLSQYWATHTISLLNPDTGKLIKIPLASPDALQRRYYIYDINPGDISAISAFFKDKIATPEKIQDILEFTAPLQSKDKLLIHCHAGISRSTAVACGVLCQHGLTPSEAVKYVLSIRPPAYPNRHILTLFDDILALKGELIVAGTQEIDQLRRSQ
jgi:predicted protein tyrosine phosphatase